MNMENHLPGHRSCDAINYWTRPMSPYPVGEVVAAAQRSDPENADVFKYEPICCYRRFS